MAETAVGTFQEHKMCDRKLGVFPEKPFPKLCIKKMAYHKNPTLLHYIKGSKEIHERQKNKTFFK